MRKRILCVLLLLGLLGMLAACGGSMGTRENGASVETSASGDYGYGAENEDSVSAGNGASESTSSAVSTDFSAVRENAKLIMRASMTVETKQFDETVRGIEQKLADLGGYIESSETYGSLGKRETDYVLRVPQKDFETMMNAVGELGSVTHKEQSSEDVTDAYADTETRLATAKTKHERLLKLLEQASTMSDIIDLENALSENEYEIDSLSGTIKGYDSLVNFATITVSVSETQMLTVTPEDTSFGSQVSQAAKGSWQGLVGFGKAFVIDLVAVWPLLLLLAVLGIIAWVAIHRVRKNGKKNKQAAPVAENSLENQGQVPTNGENSEKKP